LDKEYEVKMHDADVLENLMINVPITGDVSKGQREEIKRSVRDVMKDILHDDKVDPMHCTLNELLNKGYEPDEIRELMKLRMIYEEVDTDKPIDNKKLIAELKDIKNDIVESAEHSRIEKSF
jgi:hypothetical protein